MTRRWPEKRVTWKPCAHCTARNEKWGLKFKNLKSRTYRTDGTSGKMFASGAGTPVSGAGNTNTGFWCGRYGVRIPSRSNLLGVANDSPPLQPWLCRPWRNAAEMGTAHLWHPKGYWASIMKIWFLIFWKVTHIVLGQTKNAN